VRAERELAALQPLAVDAPQLAAVSILQISLGQDEAALATARAAASRNPRCAPAVWLQARLEKEPALQQIALQALRVQGRDLAGAHADAARKGDAAALGESCAGLRACERAVDRIPEAVPETQAIRRQVEEGARAMYQLYNSYTARGPPCASPGPDPETFADQRLEAARVLAAAKPLARPALERAAARDPDPRVRDAVQGAVALECPCWDRR